MKEIFNNPLSLSICYTFFKKYNRKLFFTAMKTITDM